MDEAHKDPSTTIDPDTLVAAVESTMLEMIDRDIAEQSEVLVPIDEDLLARAFELTAGMEVDLDLDAPIEDDEEDETASIIAVNMNFLADHLAMIRSRQDREDREFRRKLPPPSCGFC